MKGEETTVLLFSFSNNSKETLMSKISHRPNYCFPPPSIGTSLQVKRMGGFTLPLVLDCQI